MQISAPAVEARSSSLPYKWIVACVVIFGIFMSILDGTIVNIAIPKLQTAFGSSLNDVQWVLTGYTLAQGVATPLTSFFSDRIGIKRFYILSLAGFTIGSALCGIAWSLPVLIIFRIIQGATGAFLSPLAITLLYREFPPAERGLAMGVLGVPILLAPAFGPTVGGYIVTFSSWQLIFFINVPLGIIGILMAFIFLRESERHNDRHFDIPGFIFSAIGLATLLYGISDASNDGWTSGKVMACLGIGIVCLAIFIFLEVNMARQGREPLLDVTVFKNRSFTTSSIASILVTFALYGGLFLIPVYLQNLRGLNAFQSGLTLLPQAFASMVAVLIGGRLVDKIGVRAVVIPGLIIMAFAMFLLSKLNLDIPIGNMQLSLIIRSFGLGLCFQPLMVSALADIQPRRLSQATSVSTTLRFIGSSLGVAIIATLVQSQTKVHYAHMAQQVTPDSGMGHIVQLLQGLYMSKGYSANQAMGGALKVIYGLLTRKAYVLAIQDAFFVSLILAGVAIIATLFVSGSKKNKQQERELTEEEKQAIQEAMMGG